MTCLKILIPTSTGKNAIDIDARVYVWVLGQVGRAGRFGTKGPAITFVPNEADAYARTLKGIQNRFEVNVTELPEEIDVNSYSKFFSLQLEATVKV